MPETSTTIIVSVSTIHERDVYIKRIYTNLTTEPQTTFTVQKDQVNRIKVFHNTGPRVRVLIRTYLVIVIPVLVDLTLLDSILGTVDFHLDETINHLQKLINRLQTYQGRRVVKGSNNKTNTDNLERILSEIL